MARRGWLTTMAAAVGGTVVFALAASVLDPHLLGRPRGLTPADQAQIRDTLSLYNRIYQDFFASGGNPALLDDFPAVRAERHRVFRDVGFVRDAGLVLVQDLADAEVREIRPAGEGEADAFVYEEWNYLLRKAADRSPASSIKGLGQGFRYRLRRDADRWLVAYWDPEDLSAPASTGKRKW